MTEIPPCQPDEGMARGIGRRILSGSCLKLPRSVFLIRLRPVRRAGLPVPGECLPDPANAHRDECLPPRRALVLGRFPAVPRMSENTPLLSVDLPAELRQRQSELARLLIKHCPSDGVYGTAVDPRPDSRRRPHPAGARHAQTCPVHHRPGPQGGAVGRGTLYLRSAALPGGLGHPAAGRPGDRRLAGRALPLRPAGYRPCGNHPADLRRRAPWKWPAGATTVASTSTVSTPACWMRCCA